MKNIIIVLVIFLMISCKEKTESVETIPDFIRLESTVLENYNGKNTIWEPGENETKQAQLALANFIESNAGKGNPYIKKIYNEIKNYKIKYVGIERNHILCNLFKDRTALDWKNKFVQRADEQNLRLQVLYEIGEPSCYDFQVFGTKK
jgi:hypothetical protein